MLQRLLEVLRSSEQRAQLIRDAIGVGGLRLLSMPLTLAVSIVLARGLGPDSYGQYVFVIAIVHILAVPLASGIEQFVIREVARYSHGGEWSLFRGLLRWLDLWVVAVSAPMIGCITIISINSALWTVNDRWTLLLIGSFILPLLGFSALRYGVLCGLSHVFHAQLSEQLIRPGMHFLVVGILLVFGILNPVTALLSQMTAVLGALLTAVWITTRHQPSQVKTAKPAYRHGEWANAMLPFILLAGIGALNSQIGILALGWLGSEEDVAALRVAQSGGMLVALSLTIVNIVIAPHLARAYKDGDKARLQLLSRKSAQAALAVALPIALPLVFLGGPVIRFIYGEAYVATAAWPLAILAVGQLVNVAFGSVGLILAMTGHERDTLTGQLMALIFSGLAAIILIPALGATGAALSVSMGLLTWNLLLAIMLVRRLHLKPSIL